jgi:hypothetical protein
MTRGFFRVSLFLAMAFLMICTSVLLAQRSGGRATVTPEPLNLKIRYKTSVAGQSSESTTMIKGSRERSEMRMGYGMDIVNLTQCDLKRTVQISDKTRKYMITSMDTDQPAGATSATVGSAAPSTRGGVITYVMTSVDTGERKDMFGFKARHVKTTTSIDSSPDACSQLKQRTETDGWYIDLSFGLNCELGRTPMAAGRPERGGCQDRMHFRHEGSGRMGYPLVETTTMFGPDGNAMFTSTKEVVELSRDPLDAALFDVPAGYTETKNSQELFGMPSMDQLAAQAAMGRQPAVDNEMPSTQQAKRPGTLRVGVVSINNRTDRQLSTESLRARLIGEIEGAGIDAIALNASNATEAEAEARAKQCDFILYSDVTAMKTSAAKKIGGMFGRVAGVGGVDKTEAKIEFKLFAVGDGSPRLQSAATAKEEGDEVSAGTAISEEAKAVTAEVRRKGRS